MAKLLVLAGLVLGMAGADVAIAAPKRLDLCNLADVVTVQRKV